MKLMDGRRVICLIIMILLALLSVGCAPQKENYPYEPETPSTAAHEGTFVSEHGTMTFFGDGERVRINFDEDLATLTDLLEGEHEGTYLFLSGDLPPHGSFPVRYDIAHEMQITVEGQSVLIDMGYVSEDSHTGQVSVNVVTPECIPMLFDKDGRYFHIEFLKE